MKKPLIVLALSVAAAACLSAGPVVDGKADGVSFFFEPVLGKGLGSTSYDLSFPWAVGVTGSSRLEFPQIQFEAGGILGLAIGRGGKRSWLIEAGFSHSFAAMPGSMNDYDWIQFDGYPKLPFSYTYSSDSTTSWSLTVDAAWTFFRSGPLDLSLFGFYRYQTASHVEDGYTGWQWDPTTWPTMTGMTLSSAVPDVLEYTVSAHMPGLGLLGGLKIFPRTSIELRAAYTPVYVSDRDDHKLRTKLSTAQGWGNGVFAELRVVIQFARISRVGSPYLIAYGQVISFMASTSQTQYWYGNADAANGAPQGTTITGVSHVITAGQYEVGLRLGLAL